MKKHLIAAAVAAAVAAPAMAQNVTVYGAIDAGVAALNGVGAVKTSETVFTDSSIVSSIWGIRGSEDLGGGLRAIFDLQGDIQTNNGGLNNSGLFRRAANVGVAGGFGEVTFGVRINPVIATNAALMPVSGNSVSTLTASALSYHNFFTKNAVTYTTPNLNGLVAQVQYGFANTISTTASGGSVTAGSLTYSSGPLTVRAAMHDRKDNGLTAASNSSITAADAVAGKDVSTADFAATAHVAGIAYKLGDLTLAGAVMQNKEAKAVGGQKYERSGSQVGLGYQASPAWLLGLSYTRAEGSSLTNAQARYALSKRTTAYVQVGMSDNNTNSDANKQVTFNPLATNTGAQPSVVIDGYSSSGQPVGRKSTGVGLGIIHTF